MKKTFLIGVILIQALMSMSVFSQTANEPVALGLPGDNLNLYAVLDVFQKSRTLEDFEKAINDRETNINNLDLNSDNSIDYISVVGFREGNSHSIVLRVAVSNNEYQDVAVIEVNKNKGGDISIQIIGDEELYGTNYIVEPSYLETPNPAYVGRKTVVVNRSSGFYVNNWPIMVSLFSPSFSIYISPWRWGFYPLYWHSWSPIHYYNYWSFNNHYYTNNFYRRWGYVRNPVHYSYYARRRNSSAFVSQNRRSGNYNHTYQGRDFRRPEAPSRGIIAPSRRPISPASRQGTMPSRRQSTPSTRPVFPSARSNSPSRSQNLPGIRSTTPSSRQTMPSVRPAAADRRRD